MQKKCESCGKMFTPRESFHRTCFECFAKQRGAPTGREGPRAGPLPSAVPKDYLTRGYFQDAERRVVFPELLEARAMGIAEALSRANVSMGQVRRYFTMARFLENRLESGESYDLIANELRRMKANVAAVVGRVQDGYQREGLTRTLKSFIDQNVDAAVRDKESFLKGFLTHFECVLCYFVWYTSQKGR
ncbi:MAG: type III-A CRISPR-associated protein Csm2 [Planctomycetes bacterium]|nr:type III-A CRISPR-associated protein Csm2 [Planctomycetota bacterium]